MYMLLTHIDTNAVIKTAFRPQQAHV